MLKASYLDGQLLLAMPGMTDPRFDHSVIYMCSHGEEGAMGLVINSSAVNIDFPGLLDQLDVSHDPEQSSNDPVAPQSDATEIQLHAGGPVETALRL